MAERVIVLKMEPVPEGTIEPPDADPFDCTCGDRPPHLHCTWGGRGFHIHYPGDGNGQAVTT